MNEQRPAEVAGLGQVVLNQDTAVVLTLPRLRGYQRDAVAAIAAGLSEGGRGTVVAACGTGKTVVAAHAGARLARAGLLVVACPSLSLVAQTLREFTRFGVAGRVLAVCSDDTVADAVIHASDLGCPVSTDAGVVADWIREGDRAGALPGLMLVTHQSAGVLGQALRAAGAVADLVVVDEAHRTAGLAGKKVGVVHDDAHLPARRRLYLTATPRVLTGQSSRRRGAVVSMDDPATFGERLYSYPFARAIRDGWLDDYRIAVVGVTQAEALTSLRTVGQTAVGGGDDLVVRTAVVQTALARAAVEFGLRRIMVFCPWIRDSRHFAETLARTVAGLPAEQRPKGRLTSVHVDGGQSIAERRAALELLAEPPQDGWTVVSNARCLSEGVDIPAVDAVVFTAPKRSTIDIVQAVGRALRRNRNGSGIATVLVPVLLPDDPDHLADDLGEWDTVCQVVRALRAHDDALGVELDRQRANVRPGRDEGAEAAREGTPRLPPQVVLRLPDTHELHGLLRHITVRVLEGATSDWWEGYGALARFHHQHGHTKVPYNHVQDGVNLYAWVAKRRAEYANGTLAADRVEAIDRLGLQWAPLSDADQRALAAAVAFHRQHGHLRVSQADRALSFLEQWLRRQRRDYHGGTLDPGRIRELTAMGMVWTTGRQFTFADGYAAAQQFHASNGHLIIPRGHLVNGVNLNQWLATRRVLFNKGQLPAQQRAALDRLNMVWSVRQWTWARNYAAAHAYRTREGHLTPPETHREGDINLSKWLAEQRRLHRQGKLPDDRTAALRGLGALDGNQSSADRRTRNPT